MELDLRDLELLNALADYQTLTAAAENLYVSQPALSQRLSKMEDKLGVLLFDRLGRKLVPNPAGRRMLAASRQILTDLRSAERDVRDIGNGRDRRVRFTAQCSTTFQWLPPILRSFRARHPDAAVLIEAVTDDDVIGALLDDRLDVALVHKPERRMDLVEVTTLFDDEMVAVVAAGHPWATRRHVTARDFDDTHLILYDGYDQSRIPATPLPIPHGARPARVTTMPMLTDIVIEMVVGGEGVTVIPNWMALPFVDSHGVGIVQVGAKPQTRTWSCATRRGAQPAHIAAFADELVQHLRSSRS